MILGRRSFRRVPATHVELQQPVLTHRAVLALAGPAMLANLSGPLIAVVDTAVVGQIPDPVHIGAVAIGSLIFSFVFWTFGFLRMGTTGLTAQAVGARDETEVAATLGRALLIAGSIGAAIVLLQWPIREVGFALLGASAEVERLARGYFDIRIWAAPATLANYALVGWLIGIGRTGLALVMALALNVTNVVLDVVLALLLGWGVQGVATGAMTAEVTAAAVGGVLAWRELRARGAVAPRSTLLDGAKLTRMFTVNLDIMIRTLAFMVIFAWFTATGAAFGDATLAANALLMTCTSVIIAYLDGIAFATEALVGRAIGAAHRAGLLAAARLSTYWAAGLALVSAVAFLALGGPIIDALTLDPTARAAAREFLPWAALLPTLGVWAFQLDGVFIGATRTADMRRAALLALALYLAAWWLLKPFGNHGLWAAFVFGYAARALTLLRYYPALVRSVPA
jgi:MATE family multidrug resistance protein